MVPDVPVPVVSGFFGSRQGPYGIHLISTDAAGAIRWRRTLEGMEGFKVGGRKSRDGGFLAVSRKPDSVGYDAYLLKTDANGALLWATTFGHGVSSHGTPSMRPATAA